jgi:hypothetical protein
VPPPAPAWGGSFLANWSTTEECGCDPLALTSSLVSGSLTSNEGILSVGQTFEGAVLDAEGDAAWFADAHLNAHLYAATGSASMTFGLTGEHGTTTFFATAEVVEVTGTLEGGDLAYTLVGRYSAVGLGASSPIATQGAFRTTLSVWSDGSTVFLADVALLP